MSPAPKFRTENFLTLFYRDVEGVSMAKGFILPPNVKVYPGEIVKGFDNEESKSAWQAAIEEAVANSGKIARSLLDAMLSYVDEADRAGVQGAVESAGVVEETEPPAAPTGDPESDIYPDTFLTLIYTADRKLSRYYIPPTIHPGDGTIIKGFDNETDQTAWAAAITEAVTNGRKMERWILDDMLNQARPADRPMMEQAVVAAGVVIDPKIVEEIPE